MAKKVEFVRYVSLKEDFKLTSSSRGSLVTRCMGRMRNDSMGRPPHSPVDSICFRVSLKATLLFLGDTKTGKELSSSRSAAGETYHLVGLSPLRLSQQLLERPLLKGLVGAVDDVGLKMVRGVVLDDVADVVDQQLLIVTLLQVLKKPENRTGVGV